MATVYVARKGIELLNQRVADTFAKLKHTQSQKAEVADVGGDNWHDNFAFEDILRQEMMYNKQIADIRAIQNNLTLVESPCDIDSVQIGQIITVEDEDGAPTST